MDNLEVHHCHDLLLFMIQHPRWEFVYQPTYAAYLNLIEPWWKVLRSQALKGRRFETWDEVVAAVEAATGAKPLHPVSKYFTAMPKSMHPRSFTLFLRNTGRTPLAGERGRRA
jgi:hypothetical protein